MLVSCALIAQSKLKLKSGKEVKVLKVGPVINTSGKRLGLMLQYETELKLSDKTALHKEVDEIWEVFRSDVEKARDKAGIISATEKPTGYVIQHSNSYNFMFEKRTDGTWHRLEDKDK